VPVPLGNGSKYNERGNAKRYGHASKGKRDAEEDHTLSRCRIMRLVSVSLDRASFRGLKSPERKRKREGKVRGGVGTQDAVLSLT